MGDIVDRVDLKSLVPVLLKHGLLTRSEWEHLLNNNLPSYDRKEDLARYMANKGDGGWGLFLQSLKEETEHCAHKELYTILLQGEEPYCYTL